jgi:spermidine/putrescine transport system substrate-binding protein
MDTRDLQGLVDEVARGRISRRQFLERGLAMGLSVGAVGSVLAACGDEGDDGGSGGTSASPEPMDTTKPEELYLYNWQNEIAPENKTKFQERTGIKVVESYYDDNEQLLTKLKGGATGYDLIVPTSYMVSIMIKSGLLEPLDLSYVPNIKNLAPAFQTLTYDDPAQQDGDRYAVPYLWGNAGVAARLDKVPEFTQMQENSSPSWALLWDEQFKDKITMLNDERETLGAALKYSGYSFNATEQAEIDAARDKLIEQKPLVRAYDSLNMKRNIVSGVPLVHTWNGDAYLAQDELGETTVAYVLPSEGFSVWVDNLCIPKGFKSKYAAHLFMDFICEPENAADLVNYVQYLSPNAAAESLIDPQIIARTPDEATMERAELLNDVGTAARAWSEAWQEVKSA